MRFENFVNESMYKDPLDKLFYELASNMLSYKFSPSDVAFEIKKVRGKEKVIIHDDGPWRMVPTYFSAKGLYTQNIPSPFKEFGMSEKQTWDEFKKWLKKYYKQRKK